MNATDLAQVDNPTETMSSRQIAELTDKEHRSVVRDIKVMCESLDWDMLKFEHIYFDNRNRKQQEYRLPRI